MHKRSSMRRKPADINQLAKSVVDAAKSESLVEGEGPDTQEAGPPAKNPAAVALGRLGGAKGGKARAAALTKKRRLEISKKAARARWANHKKTGK